MVNVNAIVCVYSSMDVSLKWKWWGANLHSQYLGCIIFGVGEGILSETEIAHLK